MEVTELGLALSPRADGFRVSLRDLSSERLLATGNVALERMPDLPLEVAEALADAMGRGVVRLWLSRTTGVPDLSWESLCSNTLGGTALALTPGLRLVHEGSRPGASAPRSVSSNPRILVASANPSSALYPPLASAANEIHSVLAALESSEVRRCHFETLPAATAQDLGEVLTKWKPDVFHFVGHGDINSKGGFLVLEGRSGTLYGPRLGSLLASAGTRMAVLSGCFTASGAGSVAEALIEQGLEYVIGMRGPLEDGASHLFARAFYAALAEGSPVDEAVWQGRKAISGSPGDWAMPVLIARRPLAPLFPGARTTHHRTNIAGDARSFVGRLPEKTEVRRALADKKRRLVSVHGLGGMGKTRLCREVARESLGRFDAVWAIDSEAIAGPEELFLSIAATLRVKAGSTPEEAVVDAIGGDRILLLLDSLEQTSHALLSKIDALLDRCPELRILTTSREHIESKYARSIELGPMAFPQRGRSEAMRLFLETASHAAPGFRLGTGDRGIAQKLLNALDGIPLAIVLVTGRLAYLDLRTLARLVQDDVYGVASDPTSSGRHSTLGRALESSFTSLTDEERCLIRDLSVFQGGFTFDDAAAVLGNAFALLEGIGRLRRRGLLSVQSTRSEHRYRILDTVRTYLERIAKLKPSYEVRLQHAEYYSQDAVAVRKYLDTGAWESGNARLWSENGNYGAALNFAASEGKDQLVATFAMALARPYYEAGAMPEFEGLAELCSDSTDNDLRIELDGLRGSHARRNGNSEEAYAIWLHRAERCRSAGRIDDYGDSLLDCADLALEQGKAAEVEALLIRFRESESVYEPLLRAGGLLVQARLDLSREKFEAATQGARDAAALAEHVGLQHQAPYLWRTLAEIFRRVGDLPRSERIARKLITEALVAGFYHSTGMGLLELSETLEAMGHLDAAAESLAVAHAIPRSVSNTLHETAKTRYRSFSKKHGSVHLSLLDETLKEGVWTAFAAKIGDRAEVYLV